MRQLLRHRDETAKCGMRSGIGLGFGVQAFARAYADYALVAQPESPPGGVYMVWISERWFGLTGGLLAATLLILLFPNSKLPTRSWRVVVWLAVSGGALPALWFAAEPGTLGSGNPSASRSV